MRNIVNLVLILSTFVLIKSTAFAIKETDKQQVTTDIQLLKNAGFENGLAGWTATGSSVLTKVTVSPANGKAHATWDASATGEFLQSGAIAVPEKLKGRNKCSVGGSYKWASGVKGDIKLQAHDGTTVIGEYELDPATDWREMPPIMVTCPSSTIEWRLESTADAAAISLDDGKLGSFNHISVSQTELIASAYYAGTANCDWTQSGVGWQSHGTDADCPSITVETSTYPVDTTDNDLPDIKFLYLPKGTYNFQVSFTGRNGTISETFGYRMRVSQGPVFGTSCGGLQDSSSASESYNFVCSISLDHNGGPLDVNLQSINSGGGNRHILNNVGEFSTVWKVWKVPSSSAEAVTLETIGEHWDVNIGGANVSLGLASVTSYSEITHPTLDMVVNPSSKTAEIPCATTNPSTGLTCAAGNESLGIVIDVKTAGRYRACGSFTHYAVDTSGVSTLSLNDVFQWIETPNNAQTILQEGGSRVSSAIDTGANAFTGGTARPINLCGYFTFASVGKKTLRIMFEQGASGTGTNEVIADRSPSLGQRDFHITVEKLDQQMPKPAFTDLTDSLSKRVESNDSGQKIESVRIQNSGSTCPIVNESGSWVQSTTYNAAGDCTVTFNPGVFASTPVCVGTADISLTGTGSEIRIFAISSSSVRFQGFASGGGANNVGLTIICMGK